MTIDLKSLRDAAARESKVAADRRAALSRAIERHETLRREGASSGRLAQAAKTIGLAAKEIESIRTSPDLVSELLTPVTPDDVLGALERDVPIVLLPVRLETRVLAESGGFNLCVRVYPDAIHIDGHEPELTPSEQDAGRAFWTTALTARENAWRGLVEALGAQRAAWVAEATRTDPTTGQPVWQGPLAATRFARPSWAEALPDQFLFCVRSDGVDLPPLEGKRIRPPVATGPDPRLVPDADDGSDAGMRWMTDFSRAVTEGLGARVPLGGVRPKLIQRVTVFGVRASLKPADSAKLLARLMGAHRYADGLEVLRVGTPSNVTADSSSGFSSQRSAQAESTPTESGYLIDAGSDGARTAAALGIDNRTFAGVRGANLRGEVDAQAMLVALWPGTIGYFLKQMLAESVDEEEAIDLRAHAINWVRGRGPFAPLRVGRNPYGVLPVSSLAHYVPDGTARHGDRFVDLMRALLAAWITATDRVPKVGRGDPEDSSQVLAAILALSPVSVRIDARRVFPAGMVDLLTGLSGMSDDERATVRSVGQQLVQNALGGLGKLKDGDGLFHLLAGERPRKVSIPRVQTQPLSDVLPLVDNYLTWLSQASPQDIAGAEERFGAPLLYLLIRYSLLHQYERAASTAANLPQGIDRQSFFDRDVIVDLEGVDRQKLSLDVLGIETTPTNPRAGITKLSLGQDILNVATNLAAEVRMGGSFSEPMVEGRPGQPWPRTRVRAVRGSGTAARAPRGPARRTGAAPDTGTSEVAQVLAALQHLAPLPTETLDRLLRETLDLGSHRLDAWITSLATERLSRMRAATPIGAHLGAYGFVENMVPAAQANLVQPPGSPQNTDEAFDTPNQGFLTAPSLGHAATAAVLRSGHAAHGDGSAFAVALESARVRRALHIFDGVRQGQPLGALLGYQLERALLDRGAPTAIAKLRDAAPLRTTAEKPPAGVPFEQVAPRDVVDGLRIARGEYTNPPLTAAEMPVVTAAIAEVRDTLDATGDLLLAEGVHQIVAGTPARAAAVAQSAAGMAAPPDRFDVIASPRSGTALTHRVLLVSDVDSSVWIDSIDPTPRVLADPRLEGWVAARLGDPGDYSAVITFSDADDVVQASLEVGVADLSVAALDVVAMSRPATHGQLCELERRALDYALAPANRPVGVPADAKAVIASRADHVARSGATPLSDLITAAAAIGDLFLVARTPSAHELDPSKPLDADAFEIGELAKRVSSIIKAGDELVAELEPLLKGVNDADVDLVALLSALRTASLMIASALPEVADASLPQARRVLVPQGRGVLSEVARRLEAARQLVSSRSIGSGTAAAVEERREIVSVLIDNPPPIAPTIDAGMLSSLGASVKAAPSMGAASEDEEESMIRAFLARARQVRRAIRRFDDAEQLTTALGATPTPLRVVQTGTPANASWVALPKATVPGGVTSIVLAGTAAFDIGSTVSVLAVDDWAEVVPRPNEVAALAVHTDRPGNDAPQSVLVAVPPDLSKPWSVTMLQSVIDETLALSAVRMVDPMALGRYGQFLPALFLACTGRQGQIKMPEKFFFPRVR